MLDAPQRNSPKSLITSLILWLFSSAVLLMSFTNPELEAPLWAAPVIILFLFVLIFGISLIIWKFTVLYGTDTDLIKEFEFITRSKKTVPYAKIASVNVVRGFFDRILGTATIQVNINSSMNSTVPEISFVFDMDVANQIRDELSSKIYGNCHSSENEAVYESIVKFTPMDSVLHGIFGASTGYILSSMFGLSIPVIESLLTGGIGALGVLLLTTAIMCIIPMGGLIVKYYGFKVYKIGDTVYLEHGLIQQYRKSFKVSRINAVRIKRTLFARLMNKATLEVEVVGITAAGDDMVPTLCILTSLDNIRKVMDEIVPDFEDMSDGITQPEAARRVWNMKAVYASLATCVLLAIPLVLVLTSDIGNVVQYRTVLAAAIVASAAVLCAVFFFAVHVGFRINRFEMGADKFMFQFGIVDRCRVIMQYDRVQIANVYAWPLAQRLGLGRCSIHLLSAIGASGIKSGYYMREDLEKIQTEVMERIRDGRYDYRKTQF